MKMGSSTPVNMATVQNINEELADMPKDNMSSTSPPDQSAMIVDDNDQPESARTEHNGPIHDRFVHEEINAVFVPLDNSENLFRTAYPNELLSLCLYYIRDFSEIQNLFQPIIDFAEEMYRDSSLSPTSIGL